MHPVRRWLNQAGGIFLSLLAIGAVVLIGARLLAPMHPGTQSIAHAGGRIDGETYTNAIAAFALAYDHGFRIIEVDFQKTSDGITVCGHDWNRSGGITPDYTGFLALRAALDHQPCTLPELVAWLEAHPDVQLMSDAKSEPISINRELYSKLGNRLVAQAYSVEDVKLLNDEGISHIVLTLYRARDRRAEIDALMTADVEVVALTMPAFDALSGLALWAKYRLDVPVLTHTINHCWFAALSWGLGVDAFYTDDLGPSGCSVT